MSRFQKLHKNLSHRGSLLLVGLALLFSTGCGGQKPEMQTTFKEEPTEFEKIQAKADEGDEEAIMKMAEIMEKGLYDQQPHYRKAARWYQKAAELGNSQAKNEIGRLYEIGQDLTFFRNVPEAMSWYKEAAEEGNRDAQVNYAWLLEHQIGSAIDYTEAVKWYRKAAEAGDPLAKFRLGLMYQQGKGLTKDSFEAASWILQAAEAGLVEAQFEMARAYSEGAGVEKDQSTAVKWFTEAAKQGHPDAQLQLGLIYIGGDGVSPDPVEGYKWLNIAANTHKEAKKYREMFSKQLNSEDIQLAQGRSRSFEPHASEVTNARWFDPDATGLR